MKLLQDIILSTKLTEAWEELQNHLNVEHNIFIPNYSSNKRHVIAMVINKIILSCKRE